MAVIPLYARKPGCTDYRPRFPDGYIISCLSLVDDHLIDHPEVGCKFWKPSKQSNSNRQVYGCRHWKNRTGRGLLLLHRVIWEVVNGPIPDRMQIDHIDRDGLNNQINNLRVVEQYSNQRNRSKGRRGVSQYKGVTILSLEKYPSRPFRAYIYGVACKKRILCLGHFETEEQAAYAYNFAAVTTDPFWLGLNEIPPERIEEDERRRIEDVVIPRLQYHLLRHGSERPS